MVFDAVMQMQIISIGVESRKEGAKASDYSVLNDIMYIGLDNDALTACESSRFRNGD